MEISTPNFCRLCAKTTENPVDVFLQDGQRTLVQLIKDYMDIYIENDDGLYPVVCEGCREKIFAFDNFAIECKAAQKLLVRLRSKDEPVHNVDSLHYEYDEKSFVIKTKEENDPISDVGDFSDRSDDDLSPVVEKRKLRKRKLNNTISKNRSKIKKISIAPNEKNKITTNNKIDNSDNHNNESNKKRRKCSFDINMKSIIMSFDCHECSQNFEGFYQLKKHCNLVHQTKPVVKCICNKILHDFWTIGRHVIRHDESQGFKCVDCDKRFLFRIELDKHSKERKCKNGMKHACDQCWKCFSTSDLLNLHKKKKFCYFECDTCGMRFQKLQSLKTHIIAGHERKKSFVCDICGSSFSSESGFKNHKTSHSNEKPFSCPNCPKSFQNRIYLNRHLKRHRDNSVQCPKCPLVLKSPISLRDHMVVHEDIYRYACEVCNKQFKRRNTRNIHMSTHSNYRKFSCQWCLKDFTTGSSLRLHKKTLHAKELSEYEAAYGKYTEVAVIPLDETKRSHNAK